MAGGHRLLSPGVHRAAGVADDDALVAAMVRAEVAWLRALAGAGAVDVEKVEWFVAKAADWTPDLHALQQDTEAAGNPVVPLVAALRELADPDLSPSVHRGLTSQDVLDTALVLLARDAADRVLADLAATAARLAELARTHRDTVMAGRTLSQHAVPVTFGLKAARWLDGILDARERLVEVRGRLPVQCGGAAGTLSLAGELVDRPREVAAQYAAELGLAWPGRPWHTNRATLTGLGDALVGTLDALGVVASDVTTLARPEIAELHEGAVVGRGGSSTMPHKRNPVLSVLLRSAALQGPQLGAQLHLAAAGTGDERPDGAWHAEWPALARLLEFGVTAASQATELVTGLEVDAEAMTARATGARDALLAERGGGEDPADYLGEAGAFVDAVLARVTDDGPTHG